MNADSLGGQGVYYYPGALKKSGASPVTLAALRTVLLPAPTSVVDVGGSLEILLS